jgi:hypothetical protein
MLYRTPRGSYATKRRRQGWLRPPPRSAAPPTISALPCPLIPYPLPLYALTLTCPLPFLWRCREAFESTCKAFLAAGLPLAALPSRRGTRTLKRLLAVSRRHQDSAATPSIYIPKYKTE